MLAVVAIVKHESHEEYELCYAHTHNDNIDLVSERVVTNNMRLKTPGIHYKLGFFLYLLPVTSYTKKQNSTTQSFLFFCHARGGTRTLDALFISRLPESKHTSGSSLERGCS